VLASRVRRESLRKEVCLYFSRDLNTATESLLTTDFGSEFKASDVSDELTVADRYIAALPDRHDAQYNAPSK